MGLDAIYVHVKTNTSLWRIRSNAHWEISTDGACAIREKRQSHRVIEHLHKTRPPCSKFKLGGLTPAVLRYAAATYGASALRIQHLPV